MPVDSSSEKPSIGTRRSPSQRRARAPLRARWRRLDRPPAWRANRPERRPPLRRARPGRVRPAALRGILARKRGRRTRAGRNVGKRQRDRCFRTPKRRLSSCCAPVEQLLFEQRTGRHQANDVAAHQPVRLRNFELLGQRHDESLRDQFGKICASAWCGTPAIATRLPPPALFAGQRDLQRARNRFGVFAVGFVEVADAREQNGFGIAWISSRSTARALERTLCRRRSRRLSVQGLRQDVPTCRARCRWR